MKKYLPSTALLIATCGCAYAGASDDNVLQLHSRVTQLETDMEQVRTDTSFKNYGAKPATAAPVIDGYGFFFTVDFLWWKLYEGGTDFFSEDEDPSGSLRGNINHLHFDWEPGLKVGIGNVFDHDRWELFLQYTYYQTNATKEKHPNHGETLIGLYGVPGTIVDGHSNARWHVKMNLGEINLGRNFFVSKFLALQPFFGMDGVSIIQHRRFRYKGARISGHNVEYVHGRNEFWGVGPRVGLGTQFYLGPRFNIYGNFSAALFWGNFSVHEKTQLHTTDQEVYNLKSVLHKVAPTVDFDMGIAYDFNCDHEALHFYTSLGFETQYWWKQNQFCSFHPSSLSFKRVDEDLSTLGLTFKIRLDF